MGLITSCVTCDEGAPRSPCLLSCSIHASQPHGWAAAKENQPPVDLTALLAVGVAAVGAGLLHRLHSQGKKLQQAKSDLESKSSQLSEVTDELHSTQ